LPSTVHDVPWHPTVHVPVLPHFTSVFPVPPETVQLPLAQSTLHDDVPSQLTRQLPSAHANEQLCPLLQTNSQPLPSQEREQPSAQTH
jgi:hypothetical protein